MTIYLRPASRQHVRIARLHVARPASLGERHGWCRCLIASRRRGWALCCNRATLAAALLHSTDSKSPPRRSSERRAGHCAARVACLAWAQAVFASFHAIAAGFAVRDAQKSIRNPAIRSLARRGGVKRMSSPIYEEARGILRAPWRKSSEEGRGG